MKITSIILRYKFKMLDAILKVTSLKKTEFNIQTVPEQKPTNNLNLKVSNLKE